MTLTVYFSHNLWEYIKSSHAHLDKVRIVIFTCGSFFKAAAKCRAVDVEMQRKTNGYYWPLGSVITTLFTISICFSKNKKKNNKLVNSSPETIWDRLYGRSGQSVVPHPVATASEKIHNTSVKLATACWPSPCLWRSHTSSCHNGCQC